MKIKMIRELVEDFNNSVPTSEVVSQVTLSEHEENVKAILNFLYEGVPVRTFNLFAKTLGIDDNRLSEICQERLQ